MESIDPGGSASKNSSRAIFISASGELSWDDNRGHVKGGGPTEGDRYLLFSSGAGRFDIPQAQAM